MTKNRETNNHVSIIIEFTKTKLFELIVSYIYLADRAKQIKTKATVNEDPTDKLIRELREQNEKLKAQMAGGKVDMAEINMIAKRDNLTKEEIEQLKKVKISENINVFQDERFLLERTIG